MVAAMQLRRAAMGPAAAAKRSWWWRHCGYGSGSRGKTGPAGGHGSGGGGVAAAAGFHGSGVGGMAAVADDNVAQHTIHDVLAVLLVADVLLLPLALQAAARACPAR